MIWEINKEKTKNEAMKHDFSPACSFPGLYKWTISPVAQSNDFRTETLINTHATLGIPLYQGDEIIPSDETRANPRTKVQLQMPTPCLKWLPKWDFTSRSRVTKRDWNPRPLFSRQALNNWGTVTISQWCLLLMLLTLFISEFEYAASFKPV